MANKSNSFHEKRNWIQDRRYAPKICNREMKKSTERGSRTVGKGDHRSTYGGGPLSRFMRQSLAGLQKEAKQPQPPDRERHIQFGVKTI